MTSDEEVRAAALQAAAIIHVGLILHFGKDFISINTDDVMDTADRLVRYIAGDA